MRLSFCDPDVSTTVTLLAGLSPIEQPEWAWVNVELTLLVDGIDVGRAPAGFAVHMDGDTRGYDADCLARMLLQMETRGERIVPLWILDHLAVINGYEQLDNFALFFGLRAFYYAQERVMSDLRELLVRQVRAARMDDIVEKVQGAQTLDDLSRIAHAVWARTKTS